jgi:D-xylose transport system permease protein
LNLTSDAQYMITGAVLLIAVTVDSLSRRGRLASGRA